MFFMLDVHGAESGYNVCKSQILITLNHPKIKKKKKKITVTLTGEAFLKSYR